VFKRRKPDDVQPTTIPAEPGAGGLGNGRAGGAGGPAAFRSDYSGVPPRPTDSGLGVPPFRPAPPKEALMSRAPFAATPPAPPPALGAQTPLPGAARPGTMAPGGNTVQGGRHPLVTEPTERRTLVVGHGISVQGTVQDAERLVVEGTVEASMIHATEVAISPGGVFKGEVEVEDAEVAGTIDGTLTARGNLIVRATGRVLGTARCRRLQVEDGGQITGHIEMMSNEAPSVPTTTTTSTSTLTPPRVETPT